MDKNNGNLDTIRKNPKRQAYRSATGEVVFPCSADCALLKDCNGAKVPDLLKCIAICNKITQEKGKCPICDSSNLQYGDSGLLDSSYYYKWECPECGTVGTEWYDLVFSSHDIEQVENPEAMSTQPARSSAQLDSPWTEIRNTYIRYGRDIENEKEGDTITECYIDAWLTEDDWEEGKAIATVIKTKSGDVSVVYIDNRAYADALAQEKIKEAVKLLREEAFVAGGDK